MTLFSPRRAAVVDRPPRGLRRAAPRTRRPKRTVLRAVDVPRCLVQARLLRLAAVTAIRCRQNQMDMPQRQ